MRVALLVTCLIDTFFPEVGVAAVRILRHSGVEVEFLPSQTCCGQPALNAGFPEEARSIAARTIEIFERAEAIVIPSGSCAAMVKIFNRDLFEGQPEWQERAEGLAKKTYELSEFLVDVLGREDLGASLEARVTYHDGCHMLRGLRISEAPRRLLRAVRNLELVELGSQICCGFGGTFSVDYPEISSAMLDGKLSAIAATDVDYVVSSDSSCLMQISGGLVRNGMNIQTLHLAELLARAIANAN
jgi:L-lactate dehydrogenase complex protein LldE